MGEHLPRRCQVERVVDLVRAGGEGKRDEQQQEGRGEAAGSRGRRQERLHARLGYRASATARGQAPARLESPHWSTGPARRARRCDRRGKGDPDRARHAPGLHHQPLSAVRRGRERDAVRRGGAALARSAAIASPCSAAAAATCRATPTSRARWRSTSTARRRPSSAAGCPRPRRPCACTSSARRAIRTTRRWLRERRPDLVIVWNLLHGLAGPAGGRAPQRPALVVHVCDKWLYFGLYDLEPLLRPVVPWKRLATRARPAHDAAGAPPAGLAASCRGHQRIHEGDLRSCGPDPRPGGRDPPRRSHGGVRVRRRGHPGRTASPCGSSSRRACGRARDRRPRCVRWDGSCVRASPCTSTCAGAAPTTSSRSWGRSSPRRAWPTHVTLHGRVSREAVRRFCQTLRRARLPQ